MQRNKIMTVVQWTVASSILLFLGCQITWPVVVPPVVPPIIVTPTTTTTTIPPSAYGRPIDCPEWAKGGECPVPGGHDIRYDVVYQGDYTFAGNLLASYTVIKRNADGTWYIALPDVTKNGVVFHAFAYNYPSSSCPKVPGNVCTNGVNIDTFRFWIQCYEVK